MSVAYIDEAVVDLRRAGVTNHSSPEPFLELSIFKQF